MIDEEELKRIAGHGALHKMGLCTCPCYEALLEVGRKLQVENELRLRLAKASPEVLAGLTIGAAAVEDDEGRDLLGADQGPGGER
jgi:hypothetical protein